MKLTGAQAKAYETILSAGVAYAYNGISRATVAVLERKGLVTVERRLTESTNYRTKRTRYVADWAARPAGV